MNFSSENDSSIDLIQMTVIHTLHNKIETKNRLFFAVLSKTIATTNDMY